MKPQDRPSPLEVPNALSFFFPPLAEKAIGGGTTPFPPLTCTKNRDGGGFLPPFRLAARALPCFRANPPLSRSRKVGPPFFPLLLGAGRPPLTVQDFFFPFFFWQVELKFDGFFFFLGPAHGADSCL